MGFEPGEPMQLSPFEDKLSEIDNICQKCLHQDFDFSGVDCPNCHTGKLETLTISKAGFGFALSSKEIPEPTNESIIYQCLHCETIFNNEILIDMLRSFFTHLQSF